MGGSSTAYSVMTGDVSSMKKKSRYPSSRKGAGLSRIAIAAVCIAAVLLILVVIMARVFPSIWGAISSERTKDAITEVTMQLDTGEQETEQAVFDATENLAESSGMEASVLPELAELYAANPDLAGWITIEDTVVDYPVMYTPEDGEKYIYADFEGNFDVCGLPFIEDGCSLEPESDNLIIYGHNMKNGSMFASLLKYKDEAYWEAHPVISFSTLYEEREYEIIAAFYDHVYYKYEDCFKFYQFIDAEDEAHFKEARTYYKDNALYDTGVTAEYGDRLITLVTCAYHVDNGRFVVVARERIDSE